MKHYYKRNMYLHSPYNNVLWNKISKYIQNISKLNKSPHDIHLFLHLYIHEVKYKTKIIRNAMQRSVTREMERHAHTHTHTHTHTQTNTHHLPPPVTPPRHVYTINQYSVIFHYGRILWPQRETPNRDLIRIASKTSLPCRRRCRGWGCSSR